jgi:glycosyltransferase involved in cell wall biosynthesis
LSALNILFLFAVYPEDKNGSFLTKDLPDALALRGENIYVATIRERRLGLPTAVSDEYGKQVLRVKTGNMFNSTSQIEKGLTTLLMNQPLLFQVKRHWGDIKFDLIVGSTPYTASYYLISNLKAHFKCPTFLILWDIFPQNAKDLGLIKNKFLFNALKRREVKSLKQFDYIGCMTDGNINYVKENYSFVDSDKLSLFPLWASKYKSEKITAINRHELGFKEDDFIAVFGGQMGPAQNLSNIINLAIEVRNLTEVKFLFIGEGSDAENIKCQAKELNLINVTFINRLDRVKYESVMASCNVGLVSLHPDFTVPNFPSKTVEYLKYGLPILAALDKTALGDYGDFIQEKLKVGLCCYAENMPDYKRNLLRLFKDEEFYTELACNAKKTYADNFDVQVNCDRLMERC